MIGKKTFKDFWATKTKTILVLLALIIGVWGLSTNLYTYSISKGDLRDNYLQTNPASAILIVERLDEGLLEGIRGLPIVAEAEVRNRSTARIWTITNNWMPIWIYSISDFYDQQINTFTLEAGEYPNNNEIVIERDGFIDRGSGLSLNDKDQILKMQIGGKDEIQLNRSGQVHDPGLPPSHMDHVIYGYVNPETSKQIFKKNDLSRLLITFNENRFDLASIQENSDLLAQWINSNGGNVKQSIIPPPGKHPQQGQLESLLFMQLGMGLLAVMLSCILLVNVISSIMSSQIKQIGIMKATGATYFQMVRMYLSGVIIIAILAMLIALPLSYGSAVGYSNFIANELNFNVINTDIPLWINILLVFLGILIPVIITVVPINKASKISVNDALRSDQIDSSEKELKSGQNLNLSLPLWIKVAYNNTFRKKSRVVLIVFNIMLGLALLSVGLNVRSSLVKTMETTLKTQKYDLSLSLDESYSIEQVATEINKMPEIEKAEYWISETASFVNGNGMSGNQFVIKVFDDNTQMLEFEFIEGDNPDNWDNTIVVNPEFAAKYPQYAVGDSVRLYTSGVDNTWYIAGVVKEIWSEGAFTTRSAWSEITGNSKTSHVKVKMINSNQTSELSSVMLNIENWLRSREIYSIKSLNQVEFLQIIIDHLDVIMFFMIAMAVLVLIVGGIGIISVMNISVMERKREIGIMKAIGGARIQIIKIIFTEMFLFGILSWLIGWIVSIPMSKTITDFFGRLIFQTELDFAIQPFGIGFALIVVIAVLFLSSIIPIRNALAIPVHNALHEN